MIATEEEPPPRVDDPEKDFVAAVRCGRRAPHVWVDDTRTVSLLDGFGNGDSLVIGASVDDEAMARLRRGSSDEGLPIAVQRLPAMPADAPYANDDVVLARPDGIIADHWRDGEIAEAERLERLRLTLPLD